MGARESGSPAATAGFHVRIFSSRFMIFFCKTGATNNIVCIDDSEYAYISRPEKRKKTSRDPRQKTPFYTIQNADFDATKEDFSGVFSRQPLGPRWIQKVF